MVEITEKDPLWTMRARAPAWQRTVGWILVGTLTCALFGTIVPFLPPRATSLTCDRASGKCTFVDRKSVEFPISELLGATAAFHKTGGRSNRQYLHHVMLKLAVEPKERTLCDAPDDAEDRTDNAKIAADIEQFIHSADIPTLSVKCDIGRTSAGTLVAAVFNALVMLFVFYIVLRAPVGSVVEIDRSTGTLVFHQQRLVFPQVTTKTTIDQIEGVRTRTVYKTKSGVAVRLGAVLLTKDGTNLTVLRPLATSNSNAQERADAGKKLAAFLNVPVKDESET